MRPWQHALSSSRPSGRTWPDDLAVHEFLDMTKACTADRRHRMILHHVDLGAELARRAFPEREDIASIVELHVTEDLGEPVRLCDWLDCCDLSRMPRPLARRRTAGKEGVVELVTNRLHPGARPDVGAVYDLLTLPADYFPPNPDAALCILMNSFGPALARRVFGPPAERIRDSQQTIVDWGWIAEAVIFTLFGTITDMSTIARFCEREPGEDVQ